MSRDWQEVGLDNSASEPEQETDPDTRRHTPEVKPTNKSAKHARQVLTSQEYLASFLCERGVSRWKLLILTVRASDVHKKTVVACCLSQSDLDKLVKETRSFGTTTGELLSLSS